MDANDIRTEALAFLGRSSLGTVAYISRDGVPHASSVYYVPGEGFTLYFMTVTSSRKYVAIKDNPTVAFTVSSYQKPQSLQIEGNVGEVEDHDEYQKRTAEMAAVLASNPDYYPPLSKLGPGAVLLKLTPSWVRWDDFSKEEGAVFNELPPVQ